MNVLAAENVSYTYQSKYQKVQALKNVSCTFEAGKFYAIIGQSGSGKTTLLSMLAGLGTPSEGEVIANEKTLKEIGSERHRRENVTVIYQSFNLFPTLNILENVMYPMQISRKPTKEAKVRAKELLGAVGLGDVDPRKLPAMLSGGQLLRAALCHGELQFILQRVFDDAQFLDFLTDADQLSGFCGNGFVAHGFYTPFKCWRFRPGSCPCSCALVVSRLRLTHSTGACPSRH